MEKNIVVKPIDIIEADNTNNAVFILYLNSDDSIKLTEPNFEGHSDYEISDMLLTDNKKLFEEVPSIEEKDYLIEEGTPLYDIKVNGQNVLAHVKLSGDVSLEEFLNEEYENKRSI